MADGLVPHAVLAHEKLQVIAGIFRRGVELFVGEEQRGGPIRGEAAGGQGLRLVRLEVAELHEGIDGVAGLEISQLRGHAERDLPRAHLRGHVEGFGLHIEAVLRVAEVAGILHSHAVGVGEVLADDLFGVVDLLGADC